MFSKKLFHKHTTVDGETPEVVTDYNDLVNHPHINNVTLTGNKTAGDLDLVSVQEYISLKTDIESFMNSKGKEGGLASLGIDGKLASTQLPNLYLISLDDINLSSISDGEVLTYDLTSQKWVNKEPWTTEGTINGGLAIGPNAKATAEFACQIGPGTNGATKTLNFLGYRILNDDGRIPNTRLRNAAVPNWGAGEVRIDDTEYTAESDGTLFIQSDLGSWCTFTVNGFEYKIGGSVGGHMFDFRIGKGDTYKYKAGNTNALSLLWVPDRGS